MRGMDRPLFDFSFFDRLPARPLGEARLIKGRAAAPGRPALLMLPGAYHGGWCYAHYLAHFARADWGCYALDYPAPSPTQTIAELGACARAAVARIGAPVIVVGHSMGALPALLCAAQAPVAGVVLLAPSPPANVPQAAPLPPVPAGVLRAPPGETEVRERFLALPPGADVLPVLARLIPAAPEVLNDRYLLRVAVDPAAIGVPGLCLAAGRDTHDRHPPGQDAAVARHYGFAHRVLAEQPHCMMYGPAWRASADAILQWCNHAFPVARHAPA